MLKFISYVLYIINMMMICWEILKDMDLLFNLFDNCLGFFYFINVYILFLVKS